MMTPFYDKGGITIYCGDCLEILPTLAGIDSVITDPPYGIKRFESGFGYSRFKGYGVEKTGIVWDKKPSKDVIDMILQTGKYHIIWGANNFTLPESETFLIWYKKQTVDNFADAELAYCDIPGLTSKVFEYSIHKHNQTEKYHPTQKPIPLMVWCIKLLPDNTSLIIDPFMGSGTTLVAAQTEGRRAIGIEISEAYCQIAVERLRQPSFFSLPTVQPEAAKAEQGALW